MHAGLPLWGSIQPGSCSRGNGKRAYSFGNNQAVPLEQLEKDLQEGIQEKSSAGFKSEKEPLRRGITDRTATMDREDVMYGILKAQQDGHD